MKLEAIRVVRNPWMTALSAGPWALVPLLVLASLLSGEPLAIGVPCLLAIGAITFLRTWHAKPRARHDAVEVEVDGDALRIGDLRVPRAAVARAELLPREPNAVVRVGLRGRPDEELVLDGDADAHRLLTALGFDASQTTATYRLRSLATVRYRFAPLFLLPLFFLASALHLPAASLIAPAVLALLLSLYSFGGKLVVGVDGVLLRWLWVREFIATRDIVDVRRFEFGAGRRRVSGVEITTSAMHTVRLPVSSAGRDDAESAVIQKRIEDARKLARTAAHVADDALLLSRGERSMRDWIGTLKALGAGATATHRTAAVVPEQLWRVADDPAQPAMKRAAAAVALAPTLDASGRVRLAEIARATAAPKLRVALERAADDAPEEDLEEALAEMERS